MKAAVFLLLLGLCVKAIEWEEGMIYEIDEVEGESSRKVP